MEAKTHQELPPHSISPVPSYKEAPLVLEEQPSTQASPEPEDIPLLHFDKIQEKTAICGETDEEEVETDGEGIFQEWNKCVLCVQGAQALKDSQTCTTTVKWSRGKKPASRQEDGVTMNTRGGIGQLSISSAALAQEQPASTKPLKRGRGRPRKQPQESMGKASLKRPRGRPKRSKNKSLSEAAQKVSYNKRAREQEGNKRGGKPANVQVSGQPQQENGVRISTQGEGACQPLTSSTAATQEQLANTEPLKRRRGRPRKQPQEPAGQPSPKRPRGRPKGSKNKSPSKAAQKKPTGEPSPKRSRGRPKGSKNKSPFKAAQKVPYSKRGNQPATGYDGSKSGRKVVSRQVSEHPQLVSGVTVSTQGEEVAQPSASSRAAAQEQPASTEPLKRGGGRPRKQTQEPTEEPSPKRPRGRPKGRKNKSPSQAAQKVPYSRRASGQERSMRGGELMSGQERKQSQRANGVLLSTQGEEGSQPSTSSMAAAQKQPASTYPLKRGQRRPRMQPQLPVSLEEVAVHFIKEEQDLMDQSHSSLYKEVRMKDNGNIASPGDNEQEKERFVEASMLSSETAKTLVEKESFGIQKEMKRQKRNKSKNWRKSFSASREQDICELLTQQENYKGKRRINCSVCGKIFQSKFHLNIHCRTHIEEKPYECMKGGKCFSQTGHHHAYQRTPIEEKPYKCMQCGKSFSQSAHLHSHRKTHTGEKPYKCMECGKSFSQSGDLKAHQRTHTGDKPYKCMECGKSFSNHSNLRKHQKNNTGEKTYKYTKCGKTHLRSHQRTPIGEKPYMCMECGKCFNNSGSLHSHQKIHMGEKSHKRIDCGKTFSFMQTLRSHQRAHMGEKAYQCMECGKTFCWGGSLRLHQRFHTGKKPYKCLKCGRTFSHNHKLHSHQRTHTGEKPYKCIQCGKGFSQSIRLGSASQIFIFPTWWWWWFLPKCSFAHYTTNSRIHGT